MISSLETEILEDLVQVWNKFMLLPVEHADDTVEIRYAKHDLQQKILKRTGRREFIGKKYDNS